MSHDSQRCTLCLRGPRVTNNRPHSLHKTKRIVQINLQKYHGLLICTRCRRTLTRHALIAR